MNEIKVFIIAKKIEGLSNLVKYYETAFLPESYEYTGTTQSQKLERAKQDLESFKVDLLHYREHKRFDLLDITKSEMMNYLRLFAIEKLEQANDFKGNPFIVGRALRACIKAIQELIKLEPRLEIYSNKFLASRTVIKLT